MPSRPQLLRQSICCVFLAMFTAVCSRALAETNFSITIPARGLALIANHLINAQSNTVASLFPNGPEGLQFYKLEGSQQRWSVNQFQFGAWVRTNEQLLPGEGAFVRNPLFTNLVVTFSGEPSAETNIARLITNEWNLVSFPNPPRQPGFGEREADAIFYFDRQTQGFSPRVSWYVEGVGWVPALTGMAGESFFYLGEHTMTNGPPPAFCGSTAIYLNNYCPAGGIDAPFELLTTCASTNIVAQLFAGYQPVSTPSAMTNVGPPIRVIARGNRAYLSPTEDLVRCAPLFQFVELRFWDSRYGSNYNTAFLSRGRSKAVQMTNALFPYPPLNLVGLQTTSQDIIPGADRGMIQSIAYATEGTKTQVFTAVWPADKFQWQRKMSYSFPPSPFDWSDIPGATSNVLVLDPVTIRDRGVYRCVCEWTCPAQEPGASFQRNTLYGYFYVSGPPSLVMPHVEPTSSPFRFTLMSDGLYPYLNCSIERSYDLTNWFQWQVKSNVSSSIDISDPLTNRQPAAFYRVRVLNPR